MVEELCLWVWLKTCVDGCGLRHVLVDGVVELLMVVEFFFWVFGGKLVRF